MSTWTGHGRDRDRLRPGVVEQFDCPMCEASAGSACRTRGGKVALKYHAALRAGVAAACRVGGAHSRRARARAVWQAGPALDVAALSARTPLRRGGGDVGEGEGRRR
ncbi:zinc finger domain-containing protein [Nonomuraea ceibae]|uniref:zinc finger domain-containing protein n=1 Tax=Nonomuraea ceibae TaxID=1935170 RepID=UPI003FD8D63E